jgi:hypothetical protein
MECCEYGTSLLQKFVIYGRKKFYIIGPRSSACSALKSPGTNVIDLFAAVVDVRAIDKLKCDKAAWTNTRGQCHKTNTAVIYCHFRLNYHRNIFNIEFTLE